MAPFDAIVHIPDKQQLIGLISLMHNIATPQGKICKEVLV
jgi:hypothetical protein